ncbi:hypothetical protein OK016_08370 [Vibrio chagasii]|nr:hypothetical protein [Vibrio chagasii]
MGMIKAKAGPVTLSIMLVCVVIFALQQIGFGQAIFNALHFLRWTDSRQIVARLSHAVLHFGCVHAFNILCGNWVRY